MTQNNNSATERARETTEDVRDKANSLADRAKDKVNTMADSAQNKINQTENQGASMTEKAQDTLNQAKTTAREYTTQAADKVDDAMNTTGDSLKDAAQTLRQKAPESGTIGNIANQAADVLEKGGSYLKQNDVRSIQGDLEDLIRRRPVESLLVGVGLGYLLARSFRR